MVRRKLFTAGPAGDNCYVSIRDAIKGPLVAARTKCEYLWEIYEPYADDHFLTEIRNNFDARYWEMYLTVFLLEEGYEDVVCPKPGPDVGIRFGGKRIWFEATSLTRGAEGAPDQVPEMENGVLRRVPNELMLLRYLSGVSGKCKTQYPSWLKSGTVSEDDCFVIAVNPRQLRNELADSDPPRILQVALTLGNPNIVIDKDTREVLELGYTFRDSIQKKSGASVHTGMFLNPDYVILSGLLCSRVDAVDREEKMGADFQLAPNPHALNKLPDEFRLRGTHFQIDYSPGGHYVTRTEIE